MPLGLPSLGPAHGWAGTGQARIWTLVAISVALGATVLSFGLPWAAVLSWAAEEQRLFQNNIAGALRAIRAGDGLALVTLCSATAAYGFVHALGPGHGKVLLGGAALASGATLGRMAVLTVASSLAQAATAILLVGLAAWVLGWAARDLVGLTELWLAPASALAIAGIGALLVIRGLRAWPSRAPKPTHHAHDHTPGSCACGHAHGPSQTEVESLRSPWEGLGLIASIAMRPCTGALFVLVIALRMDIFAAGCLAVIAMGCGTAAFNLLVAASGVAARQIAKLPLEGRGMRRFAAVVHVLGGSLIAVLSIKLWLVSLAPPSLPL